MAKEDKALDAIDDALLMVLKIPRKEWQEYVWKELKKFCEEQLKKE